MNPIESHEYKLRPKGWGIITFHAPSVLGILTNHRHLDLDPHSTKAESLVNKTAKL